MSREKGPRHVSRFDFRPLRLGAALAGASLAVLLLTACSGAGDGGVGATNQVLSQGATYHGGADPGLTWVGLEQATGLRTSVCLDVKVYRAVDLYSVSFTLGYDPALLDFRSSAIGDALGMPDTLLSAIDASSPGLLVVGVSREAVTHGMTGVSTSSDGSTVVSLCFDILAPGTGSSIEFVPALALEDPSGAPVPGSPTWVGGTIDLA